MSRLPYPISDNWEQARYQINDLIRILFEERLAGLFPSSSLEKSGDALRMFLGSANEKLFTNVNGTGHEWANGISITGHQKDLSNADDQTLTGAGFTPSHAIAIGFVPSKAQSIGFSNITVDVSMAIESNGAIDGTMVTAFMVFTTGATDVSSAVIKSFNSDGCVLDWTKFNSPTGTATFYIMWFR